MAIRTYYWNKRKVSKYEFYKLKFLEPDKKVFRYGNAGDIFNKELINYIYNTESINLIKKQNRLLLVGSIASILEKGDIVCGIGWKGNDLKEKAGIIEKSLVYGVRGPLTLELFKKYGTDLSTLRFQYDPGLLIKEVYNINLNSYKPNGRAIFIPHYRDNWVYKNNYPSNVKFVNIDSKPRALAKKILNAEIVYTSSLHGIIFSHALQKECVFVKPQTEEPIFKYKDYFLSVGLEMPKPIESIHQINIGKDKATFMEKDIGLKDFYFPNMSELKALGVSSL